MKKLLPTYYQKSRPGEKERRKRKWLIKWRREQMELKWRSGVEANGPAVFGA